MQRSLGEVPCLAAARHGGGLATADPRPPVSIAPQSARRANVSASNCDRTRGEKSQNSVASASEGTNRAIEYRFSMKAISNRETNSSHEEIPQ